MMLRYTPLTRRPRRSQILMMLKYIRLKPRLPKSRIQTIRRSIPQILRLPRLRKGIAMTLRFTPSTLRQPRLRTRTTLKSTLLIRKLLRLRIPMTHRSIPLRPRPQRLIRKAASPGTRRYVLLYPAPSPLEVRCLCERHGNLIFSSQCP